jgi:hypothetical protein
MNQVSVRATHAISGHLLHFQTTIMKLINDPFKVYVHRRSLTKLPILLDSASNTLGNKQVVEALTHSACAV